MTTKKLLIIIFSIVGGLVLLVTLFAGAIVGIAFYTLGNSEAAATAKGFLKQSQKLRKDIGEVQDFGSFVTGSVNTQDSDGTATLYLKVIGERRKVNATVHMVYSRGGQWRVTGASYVNESGQTVHLLDRYNDSPPQ
ncbi:MAG TPA: cytochrome c oxidase assembly factor Coa1 family protein [Pyrinomonadaceae bacterium]|nr:cytochrome c oxidase assembly factor Coa1 family protein [Pyrinomonadaceae bacterium]